MPLVCEATSRYDTGCLFAYVLSSLVDSLFFISRIRELLEALADLGL